MIGKTISHYKILEKLGEGGMGVVYKAHDTDLDREVALKFLSGSVASRPEQRERFKTEARAAAALSEPGIATIHAIEEADDQAFIVMEYVDGRNLRELVNDGPLALDQVIDIARQAAQALATAHERGIVHRDIKSANIMLDSAGRVKVMDFGLARAAGATRITKTGATMGTPAYMSPEQVQGADVDARTDLWSLGVVLYETLTGKLPFKAENDAALIYQILNENPKALEGFRSDVPENLAQLISVLLQKDPDKRPETAGEVIDRLTDTAPPPTVDKNSIAVMYFENMSPDKENEYFCAGITEDLIIDLSKVQGLKVIPRGDVLPFRNKEINRQGIGKRLGVGYMLEGSVRKAGGKVRIAAQLVDVQSGFQVWAERYDRLFEDIFEVQAEVSENIVSAMKLSLTDSEKKALAEKPKVDLKAYDLYMRGRDFLSRSGAKNTTSAIKMFEHALEIDPNFAQAYIALAEAYSYQFIIYDGRAMWLAKMIKANEKALKLDPDLVEAKFGLGMVFYNQKRFREARRAFEELLTEKPDFYPAWRWAAIAAMITGDYDDSIRFAIGATRIKPYSEEPWMHLAMAYEKKGDAERTRAAYEKQIENAKRTCELNPDDTVALSRLAGGYATIKDFDNARATLAKLMALELEDALVIYNTACASASVGDKKQALELLQRAIDYGYGNVMEWVKSDPDLDVLHDDPDFQRLVRGEGLGGDAT